MFVHLITEGEMAFDQIHDSHMHNLYKSTGEVDEARLRLFGQICWPKGVDDRGARQERKGKTTENILRSSEGQPGGGRDRRGCWGK